jgi:hypothetical protein
MAMRRAAAALTVVGFIALSWFAVNVPAMLGPYGPLAIILRGPYGLIALLALVSAWGLWTGRQWARPLGVVGSLAALAWAGFELIQYWPGPLISLVDPNVSYNWANPEMWIPLPVALGGVAALVALIPTSKRTTPWIAPGIIGLLTIPGLAIAGVLPIPVASLSVPPGLGAVVALAAAAAWIGKGSTTGWLGYGLGLALGTLGGIVVIGLVATATTVEGWLVSAEVFRVNLAFTVVLIIAAAGIGYLVGALINRRSAGTDAGDRSALWRIALPVLAMVMVGLGSPAIVPERALLPADASTITVTVSADGRLTIEPSQFRAGPAIWQIASELDRLVQLVMVPVGTDADVEEVRSGAVQGATFGYFATVQSRSTSRARFDTAPARYVIFFEDEGGIGGAEPRPILPERLVIVVARPYSEGD